MNHHLRARSLCRWSSIRDMRIGPEGAVYALGDEGKLFKLTPK